MKILLVIGGLGNKEFYTHGRGYEGLRKYFKIEFIARQRIRIEFHDGSAVLKYYNTSTGVFCRLDESNIQFSLIVCSSIKYTEFLLLIITCLKQQGIKVFQGNVLEKRRGKMQQFYELSKIGLSHRIIASYIGFIDTEFADGHIEKLICKPNDGRKGKGISMFSKSENTDVNIIVQDYVKNTGDVRVLCLGGKVICAYKRVGVENSLVNNLSAGGRAVSVSLPLELIHESEMLTSVLGIELVGIDYIYDIELKKWYILEINLMPGSAGTIGLMDRPFYEIFGEYLYQNY